MAFAQARPPGIYKGDYIKELFRRYDDEDDAIAPPALPDWCFGMYKQWTHGGMVNNATELNNLFITGNVLFSSRKRRRQRQ